MKKRMPLFVLAVLMPGALFAQDITGSWQGTLQAGKDLRIVFKVSKPDASGFKAVMYSIDQQSPPLPASAISVQASNVKITIPAVSGTYEGKVNPEATSIAGTWTQGNKPLPLNLARATAATAWPIPDPPAPLKPMRTDIDPVFEVATIKPGKPEAVGKGFGVRGRNFSTMNTSASDLITFAYGLHARQLLGGPAWLESDRYDLAAIPAGEGAPSQLQWKAMLQKLLADRFKLAFHREKKELSVYAIVVTKTGAKLTKSEGDPNGLPSLFFRGLGNLPAANATMGDLASVLQSAVLDRPVVDQTGIAGRYDFTLNWTPDEFQFSGLGIKVPPPADNAAGPPDLFTAIQQELGLKLDAAKAPVDVLVIDHIEKPSEN